MSADTSPEAVAHAVARWHGYARHMPESNAKALLIDACDLIDALAAFAADACARAVLAADRAAIPITERDRRGVPLGTGAGVGGGAL